MSTNNTQAYQAQTSEGESHPPPSYVASAPSAPFSPSVPTAPGTNTSPLVVQTQTNPVPIQAVYQPPPQQLYQQQYVQQPVQAVQPVTQPYVQPQMIIASQTTTKTVGVHQPIAHGHGCGPTVVYNGRGVLPRFPVMMHCNNCQQPRLTYVELSDGLCVWLSCMGLFCFGCWPCCCVPFCVDDLKDVTHMCTVCRSRIGTSTKL